ncbi:MAG TPA: glycosyl hydrolase family 8 [Polyangiaceae bacterium]
MARLPSVTWRRLALATLGAIASSCAVATDYLGYNQKEAPPQEVSRPFTVLGELKCPDSYPNAYLEAGHRAEDIKAKIDAGYRQLFEGNGDNTPIYFDVGADEGVIRDILHNNEVRTEGMGIGMMVAAMRDDRDKFDRLWRYARDNLEVTSGPLKGTFRSRCDLSAGSSESRECLDPYGLQQFTMALVLARQRWVPSPNMVDYGVEAARLFDAMLNKTTNVTDQGSGGAPAAGGGTSTIQGSSAAAGNVNVAITGAGAPNSLPPTNGTAGSSAVGGTFTGSDAGGTATVSTGGASTVGSGKVEPTIFDKGSRLIFDDPASGAAVASTSSIMPGYYSVWAQLTSESFFFDAAASGRTFLARAANATTGLVPVREGFQLTPVAGWKDFTPEAYRALLNLAIDRIWGTSDKWQDAQVNALLDFLLDQDIRFYGNAFSLDGKAVLASDHVPELVMAAAVVASISNHPDRKAFIEEAWNVPIPTGNSRYYAGIIYMVSNLILSGRFRLCPA